MAIQFSCPYCTASVKVPDSASGKLGACPKCGTKIRIPSIPIPPVSAPTFPAAPPVMSPFVMPAPLPAPVDPGPGFPDLFQVTAVPVAAPRPPSPVSTDPFDFSNMSMAAASVSTPSSSAASRKKSLDGNGNPLGKGVLFGIGVGIGVGVMQLVLVLVGLVLVGVVIWQIIANQPVYSGNVVGERFPSERPISVPLPWDAIEVPAETQPKVIEYFQRHQTSLASSLYKLDIAASPQGLVIRFATTADSFLVSVDPQMVPDVKTLIDQNKAAWDEARKRELTFYAQQLCDNIAKAQLTGTRTEMAGYRDTVALNALVRGLGRHCVAAAKGTNYPCVFEDEAGKLYFVVHKTVTEITVKEKSGTERVPLLPPDFRIWASLPATAAPAPRVETVPAEAPGEAAKPAAEGDGKAMPDGEVMLPEAAGEEKMMEPK